MPDPVKYLNIDRLASGTENQLLMQFVKTSDYDNFALHLQNWAEKLPHQLIPLLVVVVPKRPYRLRAVSSVQSVENLRDWNQELEELFRETKTHTDYSG